MPSYVKFINNGNFVMGVISSQIALEKASFTKLFDALRIKSPEWSTAAEGEQDNAP